MPADEPRGDGPVAGASPPPPPPSEARAGEDDDDAPLSETPGPFRWKTNLLLFLGTVVSVFLAGALYAQAVPLGKGWLAFVQALPQGLPRGWTFAVPLLAILLTHEFGHYIAARAHGVDASLPYFIPLPILGKFGTMGAVIAMRGRIKSRDALLDIGASGPLAGLCVAIPVLVYGLWSSTVGPLPESGEMEGQCLLYLFLKRVVLGPIPAGYDVELNPTALAGWAGLLVTMLNLVTIAQLDGGHIAYALFGPRQNRYARVLHRGLLLIFGYNLVTFVGPVVAHRTWDALGGALGNSVFWLMWYVVIGLIMRAGGRDHPPTEPGELSPVRKGVAVLSLVMFGLLFMPTPWTVY